jgi:hypothetical protein
MLSPLQQIISAMILAYQKFSITDKDHFNPSNFPQLETSIQKVVEQLAAEPAVKIEMLLSFVKDHCINSKQVKDHPELADLISTQSLPLQVMEALFEAGKKNPVFVMELEEYIRSCFGAVTQPALKPEARYTLIKQNKQHTI